MDKVIEVLKSRRVWAGICAILSLLLAKAGYLDFNPSTTTDLIMSTINDVSSLCAIVLPILSYLNPKK